jgi:hypothetical protein
MSTRLKQVALLVTLLTVLFMPAMAESPYNEAVPACTPDEISQLSRAFVDSKFGDDMADLRQQLLNMTPDDILAGKLLDIATRASSLRQTWQEDYNANLPDCAEVIAASNTASASTDHLIMAALFTQARVYAKSDVDTTALKDRMNYHLERFIYFHDLWIDVRNDVREQIFNAPEATPEATP